MAKNHNFIGLVVNTIIATIPSGQTTSTVINLQGATLKTIILPSAFTGTQLFFQISPDGITFYDYYNIDNLKASITCSPNRAYGLFANDLFSIQYLKIISGSTEAADREIKLITRGI